MRQSSTLREGKAKGVHPESTKRLSDAMRVKKMLERNLVYAD